MSQPQLSEKPYVSRQLLEQENRDLKQLVHDLFAQGCYHRNPETGAWTFDHLCISTYENAQKKLLEWGLVQPEECDRET